MSENIAGTTGEGKVAHRYEIRYWQHWHDYFHSSTNDLDEALTCAREMDEVLDFGDNGISFIRDTVERMDAGVGNGALDSDATVSDLAWKAAK